MNKKEIIDMLKEKSFQVTSDWLKEHDERLYTEFLFLIEDYVTKNIDLDESIVELFKEGKFIVVYYFRELLGERIEYSTSPSITPIENKKDNYEDIPLETYQAFLEYEDRIEDYE